MFLQDKPTLFKSFFKWLKPGGKVLISDYCKKPGTASEDFAAYIKQRGYDLHAVDSYGQVRYLMLFHIWTHLRTEMTCVVCLSQMLKDAGFDEVIAEDRTDQVFLFVTIICMLFNVFIEV